MTDAELLDAYRATHDRRILDSLFARHYPTVYHVVLKLVRNSTDASDLTQSTFLKAVQSAESVRAEKSLRNWLLAIAINEVRSFRRTMVRRKKPEAFQELAHHDSGEPPRDADLLRREFEEQLEQALQNFPDDLKDPLVLHYYQHLSYAEVAQILGIAKSTVQSRMEQALQELRGRLKKRELLALLPELFAEQRRGRTLAWGATIMNVKILAYSAVLLCSLLVAGGVAWRAAARPRPERRTTPSSSSSRSDATGSADHRAASEDPNSPGIFGIVIDRDSEEPLPGAVISSYDFERKSLDQTLSDQKGRFRLPSAQSSSATFHLRISRQGYAALSSGSVSASSTGLVFKLSGGGAIAGKVQDIDGIPVFPYRILAIRQLFVGMSGPDESTLLYQRVLPEDWIPDASEPLLHPDGRFEFRHLAPGPYVLVVLPPGAYPFHHPDRWLSEKKEIDVLEGKSQDIVVVRPKAGTIRVHVTDRETHEPIAGARVTGLAWIDAYNLDVGGAATRTDEDGYCEAPVSLSKHGGLDATDLRVSKEGYATHEGSFSGQENGFLLEVALARPARVRGHVRTREGTPIAHAAVYLKRGLDGWVSPPAFSDADGFYCTEGLDAPHDYDVYVYDRRLKSSRSSRRILVRAGETRELDFGAQTGAGVSGSVTRRGKALRGARVFLEGANDQTASCSVSDTGTYEFEGLTPGAYTVFINITDIDPRVYVHDKFVLGENERMEKDYKLGGQAIRGVACDAVTLRPLTQNESVEIIARLVDGSGQAGVSTHTCDGGRFDLEIFQPGVYELTMAAWFTGQCDCPRVDLTSAASVEDVRVLITPDPGDGRLSIRVLDAESGMPVPRGWYQYRTGRGSCGAGHFEGASISDHDLAQAAYDYEVGSDDYVPVRLTLEITPAQRQVETTVRLLRSEAVRIKHVLPSTPAEKAGLQDGDLLLSYDGNPIYTVEMLISLAGPLPPTQKATLEIRRGGETRVLVVPGGKLGIEVDNAKRR